MTVGGVNNSPAANNAAPSNNAPPANQPKPLEPSPTMKQAIEEGAYIRQGQRGQSVQHLQEMLAARGYDVGTCDGKFGDKTKAAIEQFQRDHGCAVDGVVGPETLGAFGLGDGEKVRRTSTTTVGGDPTVRAPRAGDNPGQTPTVPGGGPRRGLGGADGPTGPSVVTPLPEGGPADQRLAEIQRRTMQSAEKELAAGVKEDHSIGNNRSPRIDQYARSGGMDVGQEWCGHFTAFNYTTAAKESGLKYSGQMRMHSYEKARSYFMYSNYTDASPKEKAKNAALREQHTADGSTRRYMTFEGSTGDRYGNQNKLPHEVYKNPADLPIRAGDTALYSHGHVGLVKNYDPKTGILTTIEGNVGNKVTEKTYDLNDPKVRAKFDGFGRPASGDFS